jgi:hypothetical protein
MYVGIDSHTTCNKDKFLTKIYSPGKQSNGFRKKMYSFVYSYCIAEKNRIQKIKKEKKFDFEYLKACHVIVVFLVRPGLKNQICGIVWVIPKYYEKEKLPVEYSRFQQNIPDYAGKVVSRTPDNQIKVMAFPSAEIYHLTVAEPGRMRYIGLRDKARILLMLVEEIQKIADENKIDTVFLSCRDSPNLVGLYEKFQFKKIGLVTYNRHKYMTMFRYRNINQHG